MTPSTQVAPGRPGIPARWTSSAKTGVGTARTRLSRVWYTLSHGIFNEVYYPRIDQACLRDMGLIVTDGSSFFSEEKRDAAHEVAWLADGVPGFRLVNTCRQGRYRITKEVVSDPQRDVVLQHTRFTALQGPLSGYHLYVLLAPHLENCGGGNTAWIDIVDGAPVLLAHRGQTALALACSAAMGRRSTGFVGVSDGWQDLRAHRHLTREYTRAPDGNVALTAELDLSDSRGELVLALGFAETAEDAARKALASLAEGFDRTKRAFIVGWQHWLASCTPPAPAAPHPGDLTRKSLAVLRTHVSKAATGGMIASLSIPWGFSHGDEDLGGYHLVWSRDMVQAAGGLVAAGVNEGLRRALLFLERTQLPDGHWSQNMWLDGSPYWDGIQMDETALPVLLVDLARREGMLDHRTLARLWPMVRRATGYLVRNGPGSPQDRWEEDPGYSPWTVGAEIAALLAAADLADLHDEALLATYLRETADVWHASIDRWMYVTGTDWCERYAVDGYYVRVAQVGPDEVLSETGSTVQIRNRIDGDATRPAGHVVSPDALALVRFGVREANDPRIRDTVTVIDATLKVETPAGPTWHRYNDDGYGEHADGSPFDGTGIGRGWPLLTGERAHYELAAGRPDRAGELLAAFERFANAGGLLPEQVWDAPDLPELELYRGRPSGSAMPLTWAHAEYLKLRRSLAEGRVFDLPPQPVQRYLRDHTVASHRIWGFSCQIRTIPSGTTLRIETAAPGVVHWSADGWKTIRDTPTRDTTLGVHVADLPTRNSPTGSRIDFTFYWPGADRWEGVDFRVTVG